MKKSEQIAYWQHSRNARKRGLKFNFTFKEWCQWWEANLGPDWFRLRGRRVGQYVMARKGDKGDYEITNVECITALQNNKDQAINGLCGLKKGHKYKPHNRHGGVKPNKNGIKITPADALSIYLTDDLQKNLAKQYGISERLVRLIKNRQVWCDVLP